MTRSGLTVLLLLALPWMAACGTTRDRPSTALRGDQDGDADPRVAYVDGDDRGIADFGHAATASQAATISTLVKDYYAAAGAENGAVACALTYHISVETLPEQYGQPPGPLYLRGASTCPRLLSLIFRHFHHALTVPVEVTGVRVGGEHGNVLVGFRTLPAGVVDVRREGPAWKVEGLLAAPLP